MVSGGKVYTSGFSNYQVNASSRPIKELSGVVVAGISCGLNHSLAWSEEGSVYSWGDSKDGKLGYLVIGPKDSEETSTSIQATPRLVDKLANVIQCACGANYSLALDMRGTIYEWGKGPAQFNLDLLRAIEPKSLGLKSTFMKIAAGFNHFAALEISGKLYTWGINVNGCLCDSADFRRSPEVVTSLAHLKVLDMALGAYFTVVLTPAQAKYKLRWQNLEHFKAIQKNRVYQEISSIKDYSRRKIRAMDDGLPNFSLASSIKYNTRTDQSIAYDKESILEQVEYEQELNAKSLHKNDSIHRLDSMKAITNQITMMLLPKLDLNKHNNSISDSHLPGLKHRTDSKRNSKLYSNFTTLNKKRDFDDTVIEENKSMIKKYTKDVKFEDYNENGKLTASIEYDRTVSQVSDMEYRVPLYLPLILDRKQQVQLVNDENDDLNDEEIEELLHGDNDLLKY